MALKNPHPGRILKEQFLKEIGMSQNDIGKAIGVPPNRIHAIVKGARAVTVDTDLRLCRFLGLHDGHFMRLQVAYDTAKYKRQFGDEIAQIKPAKTLLQRNTP